MRGTLFPAHLALLAGAIATPALAQADPETCAGEDVMAGAHDTIIRSGSGHRATIVRTDPDGTLHLQQHGQDHAALAVQSGSGGRLSIDQRGTRAEVEVNQGGRCNAAELVQSGDSNRVAVTQSGSSNRAVIRQGQE